MLERMDDYNVTGIRSLPSPRALKAGLPQSVKAAETVAGARNAIRDVIHGRDTRRLVVIAGPCSIHDPAAAFEYAERLKRGLETTRSLLLALNELGMPCGSEILNPFTPQYVGDLLCWGSIGARTVESQPHRQLASGLSLPIGFKNGTDGRLDVALNAMIAAGVPDSFLGIDPDGRAGVVQTSGNPDRHLVLRGGGVRSNFGPEDIAEAAALAAGEGLKRPVLVDCSHGNSQRDPARQGAVAREVARQFGEGQRRIMGLLIESNLQPGSQSWQQGAALQHGVSITDACIGWDETQALLHAIAAAVRVSG